MLRPSGYIGQTAGIVAFLIFIFLWRYPLRKRYRWLAWTGVMSRWLGSHVALALVIPFITAIHAAWRLTGVIGLGFWAMMAVYASGIVGRYLYAHILRRADGLELTAEEIGAERRELMAQIAATSGLAGPQVEAALRSVPTPLEGIGFMKTLSAMVEDAWPGGGPPGRRPESRSTCRTQRRNVSAGHPTFPAIDWMAAHCDPCAGLCSCTSRTLRSRTSGEYLVRLSMAPTSQTLEPPAIPGRFSPLSGGKRCHRHRGRRDGALRGDLDHRRSRHPNHVQPAQRAPPPQWPRVHGRVGARYFVAREDSASSGFSQPTADLRLDGQRLGGSPIRLGVDLRTRRTTTTRADGSSTADGHTRVYQAALHWNAPGARFHTVAGRQYLTAVTSISLFDGGLMELNGSRFSFGAFGGFEPEPVDLGFSSDIADVGAYTQFHSRPGSRNIWALTTGAVGSYAGGKANREFGFAQLSVSTRPLSIYALQEVDYYRDWKVSAGEPSVSWTSTSLSTSLRPYRWLAFNASYDTRRNVRLYRDFLDPGIAFDDAYRQGIAGGVSIIGRQVRLGGEVRRSDGASAGNATSWSGSFGMDRVTPLKLSFTTRGTWYSNPTLDGQLYILRVGADPWQPLHLHLNGGVRREDNPVASSSVRQFTWYGLDFDLSLARAWFLSFSTQRENGPDGNTNQFYGGVTWRF